MNRFAGSVGYWRAAATGARITAIGPDDDSAASGGLAERTAGLRLPPSVNIPAAATGALPNVTHQHADDHNPEDNTYHNN
jgi:hypothetical protein